MEKLTLSISNKEKIDWIKSFAKANHTSVSHLFERYLDALRSFDKTEVQLSADLIALKQPGKRPGNKEIEHHLTQRRKARSSRA